jgi:lipopolysaccharide transport system permease protein
MISIGMLKDVWAFRSFMSGSIKREFQSRFTGTQLGFLWVIVNPLAMIVIYTVIFAEIMKAALPGHDSKFAYSIYLCAGVLTWSLFAEMLARTVNIFHEHAGVLKKVNFPKLCLPIIVIASSWLHFAIVMAIFLTFLLLSGNFPGWAVLAIIPVLIIQAGFTIGLGIFLATLNVFYRDVSQGVGVVLQFWFWLTPIVYAPTILPEAARTVLSWNPVWPMIRAYQQIFLDQTVPEWSGLLYPLILAALFMWLGMYAFYRLQGEIVDEL